jgi:uncharacterized protein (TIGR00645 family)
MIRHINQQRETIFMLGILGPIDVTGDNGGYATFVNKLDIEWHADRPEWLTHIDPGTIKIKLATSLIGFSSIHLLESFVDIANENPEHIKWKIFIHMTFLGSAILLAWTDKIMIKERKHRNKGGGIDSDTEVSDAIPNVRMPFTGLFENSDKSKIRSPPQAPSIGMAVAYFQESVMQVK